MPPTRPLATLAAALAAATVATAEDVHACIPLLIPAGKCWSDGQHRITNHTITNATVAQPAECCNRCTTTGRCAVYVAWRQHSDGPLLCYLYSAAASTTPCSQHVEYHAGCTTKGCQLPPPPPPPPPYVPPFPTPKGAKDVLMIAIDDMRPELGCYGCGHMKTPHMDALAADSMVFDQAYVAVAWCSPSRTALLTSRRPDTTRTWSVVPAEYWRDRGGNFTTIPQYFRERGYVL